jgi:hypothetical protein
MNLIQYMLKFALTHWYITLIILAMIIVGGKRYSLSALKDLIWGVRKVPSFHDETNGKLLINTRDNRSEDRVVVDKSIDALRAQGHNLYKIDPTRNKSASKHTKIVRRAGKGGKRK